MKLLILILFNIFFLLANADKIIFSTETFRHGARNPIYQLWNYSEFQVDGQLTSVGMRQQYLLGKEMKKRYIDELKLLSPNYNREQLFVRSTLYNRTLMSAESHLEGLYENVGPTIPAGISLRVYRLNPPYLRRLNRKRSGSIFLNKRQPIPIETIPVLQDKILLAFDNCPAFTEIEQELLSSSEYKILENEFDFELEQIGNFFGKSKASLNDAERLFDVIENYKYSPFKFPFKIRRKTMEKISNIYSFNYLFLNFNTETQKLIAMSNFLKEFISNSEKAISGESSLKMVINSAHDSTLLALMSALNITNFDCLYSPSTSKSYLNCENYPFYATNVLMEIWEDDLGSAYVKILYNGKEMKLCSGGYNCPFDEFRSRIAEYLKFDYDAICCNDKSTFANHKRLKWKII